MRKPTCITWLILVSLIGLSCRLLPTPAPVIPSTPPPLDSSPILFRGEGGDPSFLLLGGVHDRAWLTAEEAAALMPGGEAYEFHSQTGLAGSGTGLAPRLELVCGSYFVETDLASAEDGLLGVFGGWPALRRPQQEIPLEDAMSQRAVADWLADHGMASPVVRLTRVLHVDVDGNGVDEAFISASLFADPTGHLTQAGDYSVVLMRKAVGEEVMTTPLVGEYYDSAEPVLTFPFTYSLEHVLDLNGDGTLEVVVGVQGWEESGAQVYEIDDLDVTQVLAAQCGL
jgi:hypothetical protein